MLGVAQALARDLGWGVAAETATANFTGRTLESTRPLGKELGDRSRVSASG
jgi:hypothetical protein